MTESSPCGRVLVVDDDEDIRLSLQHALSLEGYDVVAAADGAEGLELLRKKEFCLVLLDLMMPRMNGWEFRDEQMRDSVLSRVPVAVLSGAGVPWARVEALKADVYLRKPINLDDLLAVIGRWCPPCEELA